MPRSRTKPTVAKGIGFPKVKRKQPEHEFHKTVAQFLDVALPSSCWWTTFPAGGGGKARGGKLKAIGLKAGVADILILHETPSTAATSVLWIELKAKKGDLSDAQKEFVKRMGRFNDVTTHVARTIDAVEAVLLHEGIHLNARARA